MINLVLTNKRGVTQVSKFLTFLTLGVFWAAGAMGQTGVLKLDVKEKTLSNGMRVLVAENHSAPVFSTIIRFNTGSVDERPGITGISHLLEHMLFKGSKIFGTADYDAEIPIMRKIDSLAALLHAEQVKLNSPLYQADSTRYKVIKEEMAALQSEQKKYVIKDELWSTYLQNGGSTLNASTGNDGTQYFVSLPKNRLELWAFMEADRLENLVLREFYSERDVVMEERRLRTENEPWGIVYEALGATMFWASPYSWPVIGWMSDLEMVMREEVEEYFKSHYAPSNAVAAIVGDVDAEEVFRVCEKYFGKIPAQPTPPPVRTRDAEQKGERRVEIEFDANPIGIVAWRTPEVGHPDLPALSVAANLLSSGRTSRFYKNIREKKLGNVSAAVDNSSRLPSAFYCSITPYGENSFQNLEEVVYAEIEKLKSEPVSDWELQKVRNQIDASFIRSMESNLGIAFRISGSEVVTGDWSHFIKLQEQIKKVTAEDVRRVVSKYLVKSNRTVVYIVKTKSESPSSAALQSY